MLFYILSVSRLKEGFVKSLSVRRMYFFCDWFLFCRFEGRFLLLSLKMIDLNKNIWLNILMNLVENCKVCVDMN